MDKEKIYRAGVIPYYLADGQIKMLFMRPSDPAFGGKCYQISKGKQEEGETDEETAFREANEEIGLFAGNIVKRHNLGNFLGRTRIFIAEIKDSDKFGDPDFETKSVKWMTPEEFQDKGRDLHKAIVKAAVRWIRNEKEID